MRNPVELNHVKLLEVLLSDETKTSVGLIISDVGK